MTRSASKTFRQREPPYNRPDPPPRRNSFSLHSIRSPTRPDSTPEENILLSEFATRAPPIHALALGNLSNEVLPIFRPANFPEIKDYSIIEPSARLASHMLTHRSIQPILRTILTHGPLIPLGKRDSDGKELHEYPADPRPMSASDQAHNLASLHALADFVTFKPSSDMRQNADTQPMLGPPNNSAFLSGLPSTIKYSQQLIDTLTAATLNFPQTNDVPLVLTWRFALAVALLHETAHALLFAVDGRNPAFDTDPFLPGAATAEIGFAVEEAIFGGHVSLLWDDAAPDEEGAYRGHTTPNGAVSELVGMPVVWEWTCGWIVRDYQRNNCGLWMRGDVEKWLRDKDVAWRVSLSDIARLFKMRFWEIARRGPPF